jgi:hypothetical protein
MNDRKWKIARRWFAEWGSDPPVYGRATAWLMDLVDQHPDRAWNFIVTLVESAPEEGALGWVAAGSLEDLLCEHGPAFIDRIEALAGTNARFKSCLRNVWGKTHMDRSTYQRLQRAARIDGDG